MEQERLSAGTPPAAPKTKRRWLGTVIAVLLVAALGALAWYLTHKPAAGAAAARRRGRPAAARAAPRRRRRRRRRRAPPRSASPRRRTPTSRSTSTRSAPSRRRPRSRCAPQVSGVLTQVLVHGRPDGQEGPGARDHRSAPVRARAACRRRARCMRDEAQLDAAKRARSQRYQTLLQQDSIARQDVDTQAALVKQLEGTVADRPGQRRHRRLNLGCTRIVAPVSRPRRPAPGRHRQLHRSPGDANGVAVDHRSSRRSTSSSRSRRTACPQIQARIAAGADAGRHRAATARAPRMLDTGTLLDARQPGRHADRHGARPRRASPTPQTQLFPSQFVNVRLLLRHASRTPSSCR